MNSDLEIARAATLRPIREIAGVLGLAADEILPFGHDKAKVPLEVIERRADRGTAARKGRLVLVTGINPTPAGEGKSTMAVGLADACLLREMNPVLCLREPSLGPVFGVKGGAAGGGHSQVVPMEDINLHFTGDLHAISAAHALLAALLDNHLFRGQAPKLAAESISWPRAVDMNDRALRQIRIGLGGASGGVPRDDGFVITAASEIMAIFCLADGLDDLRDRLARIVVGTTREGTPVTAGELGAAGAMTVLLRDALNPNLVQTIGGTPAFVHGGPFANIAHGCNSLVATRAGLALGDVVITEAGFGADLGAEKFFDIKCRAGGLEPDLAVVVATVRALKMHGGVARDALAREDAAAVRAGFANLEAHLAGLAHFGVPAVVALHRFASDTAAEVDAVLEACRELGVEAVEADPWGGGGAGCLALADRVADALQGTHADYRPLYELDLGLADKIERVARDIYGADGVEWTPQATAQIADLEAIGLREVPVCIAKTQYSLSDDPKKLGRPSGFDLTVRQVTPSAGAGFVVARTGDVMAMPGLPAVPAALQMDVRDGEVIGLF